VAKEAHALETARSTEAFNVDVERILPVLFTVSQQAKTRLGTGRGEASMEALYKTAKPETSCILVLPNESGLVQTSVC
jgi:hypothetical protein